VIWGQFLQFGGDDLHSCNCHGLRSGIELEQSNGGRTAGIDKDLRELGKQDREERLDFIFVARGFIGELAMHPY
jgi:hypothetical protein